MGRGLWHGFRKLRHLIRQPGLRRLRWCRARLEGRSLYLFARGEQAPPIPTSRVLLTNDKNELGTPRPALHWQLSGMDKHSVEVPVEAVGRDFEKLGIGRVEREPWLMDPSPAWPIDATASNYPLGGYHHMGTTRMSAGPKQGVVNPDCCIHGYENLHVAGSSVFPTGGWANPTLTILALAHRLGEHLIRSLKQPARENPGSVICYDIRGEGFPAASDSNLQ